MTEENFAYVGHRTSEGAAPAGLESTDRVTDERMATLLANNENLESSVNCGCGSAATTQATADTTGVKATGVVGLYIMIPVVRDITDETSGYDIRLADAKKPKEVIETITSHPKPSTRFPPPFSSEIPGR